MATILVADLATNIPNEEKKTTSDIITEILKLIVLATNNKANLDVALDEILATIVGIASIGDTVLDGLPDT